MTTAIWCGLFHSKRWCRWFLLIALILPAFGLSACSHVAQRPDNVFPIAPFATTVNNIEEGLPSVRLQAIIQLLRYEDPRRLDILLRRLSDPDPTVRYAAAWVLREGSKQILHSEKDAGHAIETIVGASGAQTVGDLWGRTELIKVLDEIKKQQIIRLRQDIADASGISERELEEITSVQSIPDAVLEAMKKNTTNRPEGTRPGQQIGLEHDPDERVLAALLEMARESHPYIREAALQALFRWRDDPRVQTVRESAFRDSNPLIRQSSLFGGFQSSWELGFMVFINGNELVAPNSESRRTLQQQVRKNPALKQMVRDENQQIRRIMASILRSFENDPDARELLIERLGDPSGQVVFETINWLGQLREGRALDPLLDLQNTGWNNQPVLLDAISAISGKPAATVLAEHDGQPRHQVEGKAAIDRQSPAEVNRYLGAMVKGAHLDRLSAVAHLTWVEGDARVEEALFQALSDPDPEIRWAGVGALARYPMPKTRNSERVLDALIAVGKDPHPRVREHAITTLGIFLPTDQYRDRLLDYFEEYLQRETDPFVRAAVASDLRQLLWSRRSTRLLATLLGDDFYRVRKEAAVGINAACVPEMTDRLIQALRDPEPDVRKSAADRLQWASGRNAVRALSYAVNHDPDESVVKSAANSLRNIQSRGKNGDQDLHASCGP